MHEVKIGNFTVGNHHPLALICGPCMIESRDQALFSAKFLKELCDKLSIPLIYKSSYDKANRSSIRSERGPGLDQGLFILEQVKQEFELPITTDIHSPNEVAPVAEICDLIQIPAFLCRQTDLLVAAGQSKRPINVKKGQFLAPWDMKNIVEKIESTGNRQLILTERGASFGYNNLVFDIRSIPIMQSLGYPVCFDATHSVQLPGGHGTSTGGQREFAGVLAKAAVAASCNLVFIEAHPDPSQAKSDKDVQIPFDQLEELLILLKRIHQTVQSEVKSV